jgi:hypothetical protein
VIQQTTAYADVSSLNRIHARKIFDLDLLQCEKRSDQQKEFPGH